MPASLPVKRLARSEWERRAEVHHARLAPIVTAHRDRRARGHKHPVMDFLFEYYRLRPASLLRWSPGAGVLLEDGADVFGNRSGFTVRGRDAWVDPHALSPSRRVSTEWILDLLKRTQARPPAFGCFGAHEWAMVYNEDAPRHAGTPLRLGPDAIRTVVESNPLQCSHYDAFRFFTPAAKPLNRTSLTPTSVHEHEQPGCLHVNMDVYRWAMKRYPWIGSDLIADAFLLAVKIRVLDMQASPYDLASLGYAPVRIETEAGREEYRERQTEFYRRAGPIRARLIQAYQDLLDAIDASVAVDGQVVAAHVQGEGDCE